MAELWKRGTGAGDVRLDRRAALMLEQVVATHSLVLDRLGGTRAGAVAAGRLLASGKVDPDDLLASSIARTKVAIRGRRIVAAQDTTEINFAGRDKRRQGLGPAGDGVSKGFFIHPVIAIDAEHEAVLGLLDAHIWTRGDDPTPDHANRPFDDKESARWRDGVTAAARQGADAASIIVVGDRESDIYEVFAQRPEGTDLIIRSLHDRRLEGGGVMSVVLAATEPAGCARVKVASQGIGDKGRTARVVIRFAHGAILPPKRSKVKGSVATPVPLRLIEVAEVAAPDGVTPLLWRLVTTMPVASLAEACEIVRIYRLRWRIEETFRTLKKDGMRLDETQVQSAHAVMNLAALGLAAAVRIIQLVDARDGGPRPATDVIDAADIEHVARIGQSLEGNTQKQKNGWPKGSLAWLSWIAARLGGWNCYYRRPGPKTMAHGWDRLSNRLEGIRLVTSG